MLFIHTAIYAKRLAQQARQIIVRVVVHIWNIRSLQFKKLMEVLVLLHTDILYLVMKDIIANGINSHVISHETRLITQKAVYLFDQMWGGEFYDHSWYLAGPYSSILTHQIHDDLLPRLEKDLEQLDTNELSYEAKCVIESIKSLIASIQKLGENMLSESDSYELAACIWYIAKGHTEAKVKRDLLLARPKFKMLNNIDQIIELVEEAMRRV